VGFNVAEGQEVFFRIERYRAGATGFGYVDPATYETPDNLQARVRLTYPFQDVDKLSVGYSATNKDWAWANSVQATLYSRNNERQFDQDIFIPFGSLFFGLQVDATNFTDVESLGVRFEANKLFGSNHMMTYGLDWWEDDIEGTNTTITTFVGPPEVDETPTVPNSTYGSWGLFAQDQWRISRSVNLIFGARHQETSAETRLTPNMDPERAGEQSDDKATVGAVFPEFNVNALRGGVTVFRNNSMSHQLGLSIENLTNALYTETSNASFFRPEPGRNIIASYRLDF